MAGSMCSCRHCGNTRMLSIYAKCNDLAEVKVPHLDLQHEGYMPHLGIFGGDDLNLVVCMQCGTLQVWQPITDEEVSDVKEELEEQKARRRW